MNILLEKLFDEYKLNAKDRYELNQIFTLVPEWKKQSILNNFDLLVLKIRQVQEEIKIEQEILIWDSISRLKDLFKKVKERHPK